MYIDKYMKIQAKDFSLYFLVKTIMLMIEFCDIESESVLKVTFM